MRCLKPLALTVFLVVVGVFTVPACAQQSLHNSDISVSVFAQLTSSVSGNGIHQYTTDSVGGQAAFRHSYHWWLGYEGSYAYTRFAEYYSGQPYSYQHNLHDFSGAYLVHGPSFFGLSPFAEAGVSALIFSPTKNGGQNVSWQGRPGFNFSVGLNQTIISHVGIRVQYRGVYYKAPDFGVPALTTNSYRLTNEPMIGAFVRF